MPGRPCTDVTALRRYSPLVLCGGGADALRIVELQPEGAASIIDTDLEVDVLPSVEAEEKERAEAEAKAKALQAIEEQRRQQIGRAHV